MLSRCVVSQVKHNSFFVVGMALGLWASLVLVPISEPSTPCPEPAPVAPDDYTPEYDTRRMGPAPDAPRSLQRPRYYSTELGMRGSLLVGILSSEDALKTQVAALNRTCSRLQPALKFFMTASAMSGAPGLANVVGFTDTREMLKPFHALKYLADNYLEEFDFFFLSSDTSYINARRLQQLVSKLSVSQDIYMGVPADDTHYCDLDSGIILSNSVVRSIHGQLDWCVRNSYSPRHHENLGRCILHAAHLPCSAGHQGLSYTAHGDGPLGEHLADAVTIGPVSPTRLLHLHAFISRVHLQRAGLEERHLRKVMARSARRHPPGYKNDTWPAGLRDDPGLAPPLPDNRFDHLRWTSFNATHAFYPDDHHNVLPITGAYRKALDLVLSHASAWCKHRWPEASVSLVEGAFVWVPATALKYRLLLRIQMPDNNHWLQLLEVVRGLGAARLVPVRYVTESARVWIVLPVPLVSPYHREANGFLSRYETTCLVRDANTALLVVLLGADNGTRFDADEIRAKVQRLQQKYVHAQITVLEAPLPMDSPQQAPLPEVSEVAGTAALAAASHNAPADALLLLLTTHADYNQDLLNRARMNTIQGEQWFWPVAFARHSQYDHPRFKAAGGGKPHQHTGRFNIQHKHLLSVYNSDYKAAASAWRGARDAPVASMLGGSAMRCVRAPEPALLLAPRPMPCAASSGNACLARTQDLLPRLDVGARTALAQLLLETQAELE